MHNVEEFVKVKFVYLVSFFLYCGYYSGLALLIYLGDTSLSRLYSIPLRLLLVLTMVLLICISIRKYKTLSNKYEFQIITFFSLIYIIKIIYTQLVIDSSDELLLNWSEYIFYYLSYCLLPFYAFSFLNYRLFKRVILNALIFSGFTFGLMATLLYKEFLFMGLGRISMIQYVDPSVETLSPLALSYGSTLTISLCIFKLTFFRKIKLFEKSYLYLTILLSLVAFVLGSSRGSILALIFSLLIFLYLIPKSQKYKLYFFTILLVSGTIWIILSFGSSVFERAASSISEGDTSGRGPLWQAAINEFLLNPILGGKIEVLQFYPHNVFLEILMATGLIGFLLFSYTFLTAIFRGVRASKIDMSFTVPLIILFNGVAQYMFSGAMYFSILLFAPMGMIYSSYIRYKEP